MKCKCPRCYFEYELETKAKLKRSGLQNSLYWVWMTLLGEDIGYTKEGMHYVFKRAFLADKMPVLGNDEFMDYLKQLDYKEISTTKLSVEEMKAYLEKVNAQAFELSIVLPIVESTRRR